MAQLPLTRIYAQALIELGDEHQATDRIADEFAAFQKAWEGDAGLRRFLSSPAVSRDKKVELITAVGQKLHEDFRRFLCVLADKGRILFLRDIYESYRRILEERGGLVRAKATFAVCMEEKRVAELERDLSAKLGKRVSLWVRQDEDILGGVILQIGDRRIDASLRRKLEEFRRAAREAS